MSCEGNMSTPGDMIRITRRTALSSAAAGAVVAAIPGAASATSRGGANDARLLELDQEFWPLYRQAKEAGWDARAYRAQLEALPTCPPMSVHRIEERLRAAGEAITSERVRELMNDAHRFLEGHGVFARHDRADALHEAAGRLANAIFATPAESMTGLLIKLKVLHHAYGDRAGEGDEDLEIHQGGAEIGWFQTILDDAARLVDAA